MAQDNWMVYKTPDIWTMIENSKSEVKNFSSIPSNFDWNSG